MTAITIEALKEQQHIIQQQSESAGESTQSLPSLDEVEQILGYDFNNKRLLEEAFTHASLGLGFSNERLEYVGDSVLNLLFTKQQFFEYPDLPPGPLTRLRAANVDTEKLARAAVKHCLHRYLRHKKPLLKEQVFKDLLEPIIRRETLKIHPVTQLYEVCQKRNLKVKFVDLWKESTGFDVFVDDQLVGRGKCSLKKEIAHNRAAKDALDNILRILDEKDTNVNFVEERNV
ncbi:hypothetical protein E1A91_D11G172200v1 [Gossypium mustelinum]|uniref:RNase III domain-containing protein n=1 Tax=Gossypium mustelinum TaxID=34275 RepID=A0A5D2SU01_GOSMU|nr:hypothetical protein E1A91_D11G172200v1 [Gossypium mustelinum]